jgi:hypothetical protein
VRDHLVKFVGPCARRLCRKFGPVVVDLLGTARADGAAGEGWDLLIPLISVETKWGVPEYNDILETDTYVFEGRELIGFRDGKELSISYRTNFNANPLTRAPTNFRLRRDDSFADFIRHGAKPSEHWWEVIYKNGNREYYGGNPVTGLVEETAVRRVGPRGAGPITQWGLTAAVDPDGNEILYTWAEPEPCSNPLLFGSYNR